MTNNIFFDTHGYFHISSKYPLMNYEFNIEPNDKLKFKIKHKMPYRPDPDFMTISKKKKLPVSTYIPEVCLKNKKILRSILPAYVILNDKFPEEPEKRELLIQRCFLRNQWMVNLNLKNDYNACVKNLTTEKKEFIKTQNKVLNAKYSTLFNRESDNMESQTGTTVKNQITYDNYIFKNEEALLKYRIGKLQDFCEGIENVKNTKKELNGPRDIKPYLNEFKLLFGLDGDWTLDMNKTKFLTSNVRPLQICLMTKEGINIVYRFFSYKIGDDLRNDAFVLAAAELLKEVAPNMLLLETNDVIPFGMIGKLPITSKEKDTYGFISYYTNWKGGLSEFHKDPEQVSGGGLFEKAITVRDIPVDNLWKNFENKIKDNNKYENFKKSLMGSILLQWIFGLHDRHSDNMGFLRDGQVVNIDFNRIMNQFRALTKYKKEVLGTNMKISKDTVIDAPFIFSPDLAYLLAKCYDYSRDIKVENIRKKGWTNIPDFYLDEKVFKDMFMPFAKELHNVIQKINENRSTVLDFVKLMSYTNNPRFMIQREDQLYYDRNYRGNDESRSEIFPDMYKFQKGGNESIYNTAVYATQKDYNKAKTQSLTIYKFGYAFVESVMDELKTITPEQLCHKLWLAMRLTPYKVLFGVHELSQDIKQKIVAIKKKKIVKTKKTNKKTAEVPQDTTSKTEGKSIKETIKEMYKVGMGWRK